VGTRGAPLHGGWHTPAPTWRLGSTSVLGTPCVHVALGLQPLGGHSPAHTWSLGCLPGRWPHPQPACGAWARQGPTILGPRMLQNPR